MRESTLLGGGVNVSAVSFQGLGRRDKYSRRRNENRSNGLFPDSPTVTVHPRYPSSEQPLPTSDCMLYTPAQSFHPQSPTDADLLACNPVLPRCDRPRVSYSSLTSVVDPPLPRYTPRTSPRASSSTCTAVSRASKQSRN